jgi:hypothetical protein
MRYLITVNTANTHGVTTVLAEAGFPPLGNLFLRGGRVRRNAVVWTVEVEGPPEPKVVAIRAALTRAGFANVTIEQDRREERDRRGQ